MTKTISAAVALAPWETEIRELPTPPIPEDGGLLKVEVVGVCGTDVSWYEHLQKPMILGHHVVGYVAAIGRQAARQWGLREGDRVAMEEYLPCGRCTFCRTGRYRLCEATDSRKGGLRYGATPLEVEPGLWGGFAQYLYLHPHAVMHRMPDAVPPVEAALTLPLSNGFEWMVIEGQVGIGKSVVIQGPGQQGLACALAAKAAGADLVIVTGRSSSLRRLELAKQLGADHVINVQTENLVERVKELTGGEGADVVLDVTSGGTEPILQALQIAAKGGTVILGAYKYEAIPAFDSDLVVAKTLTIKGVRGHGYQSVEMAVECIASGRFPMSLLNSHNYRLADTDLALRTASGRGEPNPLLVTVSPWQ
ncbi:MAG: zinc-binding dehydrogenase [Firmicutes bacterium]|nr:zinc-binding dehydrogenase [Bacillota bacterium]